ncbi:hypothetical protein F5146DRAFT_987670 [Armillaria mellea]|nr:hypothetical protein F5146DRAFT_987670 [Armillaria mellea]
MTIFHIQYLLLLLTAQTRAAQGNDECSNDSSNRTIWDIIGSCLATIFACTWLAVHPNVPSRYLREKGRLFLGLHRVKHTLLAAICPEIVVMWAFRQRLVASALSKRLSHLKLSLTHGFFISMGGFIGKNEYPITAASRELRPGVNISPILSVTRDELMDKSKGDALLKSISLLQTTWFVVQYFSRITLSLPTTPLETATLAFALLNFCNYILWWHKPLDVQYPLNSHTIDEPELLTSTEVSSLHFARSEEPEPSVSLGQVQLPTSIVPEPENTATGVAEPEPNPSGYADTASELRNFPSSPPGRILPTIAYAPSHAVESTAGAALVIKSENPNGDIGLGLIKTSESSYRYGLSVSGQYPTSRQQGYTAIFGGCFGALFGGIHCIQWSSSGFSHPSLEHLLWKFSSLLVAIVPIILAFEGFCLSRVSPHHGHCSMKWFRIMRGVVPYMNFTTRIFIFIYICARVYLLVDMFASLRSLPPGASEEID